MLGSPHNAFPLQAGVLFSSWKHQEVITELAENPPDIPVLLSLKDTNKDDGGALNFKLGNQMVGGSPAKCCYSKMSEGS